MNKKIIISIIRTSALVFICLIFSHKIYAQDLSFHIENSVYNLKEKLILSDEQVNTITEILNKLFQMKYYGTDSSKIISDTNNRIEAYLDKKQRIKFDIIKSDWWKKLLDYNPNNSPQDSILIREN